MTRRGFDAYARGDFEAAIEHVDPEVEWHVAFRIPDLGISDGVVRGRDQLRELWERFGAAWEVSAPSVEEILHEEEEWVVCRVRFRTRGAGSGVDVDRTLHYAVHGVEGKLRELWPFETAEEAMEKAGAET